MCYQTSVMVEELVGLRVLPGMSPYREAVRDLVRRVASTLSYQELAGYIADWSLFRAR